MDVARPKAVALPLNLGVAKLNARERPGAKSAQPRGARRGCRLQKRLIGSAPPVRPAGFSRFVILAGYAKFTAAFH